MVGDSLILLSSILFSPSLPTITFVQWSDIILLIDDDPALLTDLLALIEQVAPDTPPTPLPPLNRPFG